MRVAVLAVDGMFDSGLTAVLDVLATANALSGQAGLPAAPFEVTTVGAGTSVRTGHGLQLATTAWPELDDDPARRPELAVMPAVGLRPPAEIVDVVRGHRFLTAITELAAAGAGLAGACSGTFFLAEAGVLDERTATTSWWLSPAFRARYPRVDLDDSRTLAIAGNVTTAGAAFAHIDLALSLVHRSSPALSELVSRYLVIGDRPSQAVAAAPSLLATGDPTVAAFERYIRAHLAEAIGIDTAARALGVSERTLQRVTRATLGMSPIRFVQEVRLEQATVLLRTSTQTPAAIALAVGYQDVSTLRTLIRRRRHTTLAALRRR
ncbi:MAG: helix-turn-helix domain-containing protein [Actinobacteria bacterium]|nr:helix-turn-helix domain-containing protein [Actinomycetota bacterium]